MSLDQEINESQDSKIHQKLAKLRNFMSKHPLLLVIHRFIVITVGLLCILAGIVMLVTPGPGWLFIFLGMGLWGTEFAWAHRLNLWAKAKVLGIWRRFKARAEERRQRKNQI
ncbi:TIGR02611 family protein [Rothia sp. P7181]|uniref:TIGR02611 family protein n=1 Tax=unclassified Rothia (in: high G+C Gram-positive bacteria) TaxID=2689056 RepID=UPI003AD4EF7B